MQVQVNDRGCARSLLASAGRKPAESRGVPRRLPRRPQASTLLSEPLPGFGRTKHSHPLKSATWRTPLAQDRQLMASARNNTIPASALNHQPAAAEVSEPLPTPGGSWVPGRRRSVARAAKIPASGRRGRGSAHQSRAQEAGAQPLLGLRLVAWAGRSHVWPCGGGLSAERQRDSGRKLLGGPCVRFPGRAPLWASHPPLFPSGISGPAVSGFLLLPGRRRARYHECGLYRRGPAGLCPGAGLHGRR